jgi:hypothetical protein
MQRKKSKKNEPTGKQFAIGIVCRRRHIINVIIAYYRITRGASRLFDSCWRIVTIGQ